MGQLIADFVMKILKFDKLNEFIAEVDKGEPAELANILLEKLDVNVDCKEESVNNIPKSGGALVVANFPHGIVDCLALLKIVAQKRSDIKFLLNPNVAFLPIAQTFALKADNSSKLTLVKEAIQFLLNGGLLIVFPSQKIATLSKSLLNTKEGAWDTSFVKLAKITKVPIVPVFIDGKASKTSLVITKMFENVGELIYAKELFKQEHANIGVAIGAKTSFEEIVKVARVNNFVLAQQAQIVTETLRATCFVQAFKLNEDYKVPLKKVAQKVYIQNEIPADAKPNLETGSFKAYFTDNKVVILNRGDVLMKADYLLYYFNHTAAHNDMACFEDFEFNYRHLSKWIKSCVELTNVQVDFEALENGGETAMMFVEKTIKMLVRESGVDIMLTNVRSQVSESNFVTSAFVNYLESRYSSGSLRKVIISRGLSKHSEYVGRSIRTEMLNFYSAALFANVAQKVQNIEVNDLLSVLLNAGAKVGSISLKTEPNGKLTRSFLVMI